MRQRGRILSPRIDVGYIKLRGVFGVTDPHFKRSISSGDLP